MRRFIAVTVVVVAVAILYRLFAGAEAATGTLTLPQPAPDAGQKAPTFTAESASGRPFRLTSRGTYVLVFWDSLDSQFSQARRSFTRLARRFDGSRVSFVAVYIGQAPDSGRTPYTVLTDRGGRLSAIYNVKRVPRLFLIHDGRIVLVQNGYYEANSKLLARSLKEILSGKAVRHGPEKS